MTLFILSFSELLFFKPSVIKICQERHLYVF